MAYLLTAELPDAGDDPAGKAAKLFRVLDQGALFTALTLPEAGPARTDREIWPGLVRRERRQVLVEVLAEAVRDDGASPSLVSAVVRQAVACRDPEPRLRRAVEEILASFDDAAARRFVVEARAAAGPEGAIAVRALSDLLVRLIRRRPGVAADCEALLAEWEAVVPGMRLKAFHARLAGG